ncbi:UDP-N-acetylmuramoyl-L-alanyl-D-glutamate--2,6-diaminopimelate ligase [Synergistales bacterium]|nr:UDP-N-acetylmuramoyl-L-alanyl-D-glutamate--2,6-diaminopimelate ligase [Synergistales bacterium]
MRLDKLFSELSGEKRICGLDGSSVPDVSDVVYDSRAAAGRDGVLFACFRGTKFDGHDFARSAAEAGCAAVLCERELSDLGNIPQIITHNVRAMMGEAAAIVYGRPAEKMTMIGLTGTNGKTTTAYIMRSVTRANGTATGMMGTIVRDDGASETEASRTTPEGPDVQRLLASMARNGVKCCVMEASSHGLDQGRLRGCKFDRVAFSNLTYEHQEYHDGMESYFAAKRLLFSDYTARGWRGAANADDEYGRRLLKDFSEGVVGFTMDAELGKQNKYFFPINISTSVNGVKFDAVFPDGESAEFSSPLIGSYNISNILESAAIADSMSVPRDAIARGVKECVRVPGRLERYSFNNGVSVFIDFAHSPDGVEKVLRTLKEIKNDGRLWILWGAGGDRSREKRPIVGKIMGKLADKIVITSDNPRNENPNDIARDVEAGVLLVCGADYDVIADRKKAVYSSLDRAKSGDVVLIAGKGPENYIEYGDYRVPFKDADAVLEWAKERGVGCAQL